MKRTKKQKTKANDRRVNSQLAYKFEGTYNSSPKNESAETTEKYNRLASIKKELYKSLFVAFLILISLVVIYWVS
ncbi:MAG: hypothetical protein WA152_04075 [Microgenomates group bacterium]